MDVLFVPETLLLGALIEAGIVPTYDDLGSRVCPAALFAATQDGKPRKGPLRGRLALEL